MTIGRWKTVNGEKVGCRIICVVLSFSLKNVDVKQVLKERLSSVGNGIMREFHYIVDFLNWISYYASYIYFIIRVPGGGQISKELTKWNPTLVSPSFAKDTGASNINLKVGMFQWEALPVFKVPRTSLRWQCLSSLDHYTEFPHSWMEKELGLDKRKIRKKMNQFLHIRVFGFIPQMLLHLLIYI